MFVCDANQRNLDVRDFAKPFCHQKHDKVRNRVLLGLGTHLTVSS